MSERLLARKIRDKFWSAVEKVRRGEPLLLQRGTPIQHEAASLWIGGLAGLWGTFTLPITAEALRKGVAPIIGGAVEVTPGTPENLAARIFLMSSAVLFGAVGVSSFTLAVIETTSSVIRAIKRAKEHRRS